MVEYAPLRAGQRELVDEVWPLYLKTSQRHGHNVTSRADFYRIHCSGTRGLSLLTMRVGGRGQGVGGSRRRRGQQAGWDGVGRPAGPGGRTMSGRGVACSRVWLVC